MYNEVISEKRKDLDKAIEHLQFELGKLRTGRATPSLVEDVMVDYYGTRTPLKQIASINTPEPRQITIQPWDRGAIGPIEGAIRESDLGLNPINDGILIRLSIPALTEERRKELVKVLNNKAEEGRIALRNVREDALKEVQNMEKEGLISEDDKFRAKEKLQGVIDEYNKKVEEIREKKEKDIMTV
ncbi:MAG TPA: ribosome recycling factor [Candidatus Moranbacteria bacterium]|nr:MAG: Ribosome-recycling factor [Candidatus Moranbacteria bacterium GW2011_GWC2_45_10]KKT95551.1 MAG: ribosome recycling factor, ribosome recycling factor [Parcubacteria group bacterium GW2011_GWC1_45_14]HAV11042.1 ribosome recycling factor [Candidatus Moranbacteria bacterium]